MDFTSFLSFFVDQIIYQGRSDFFDYKGAFISREKFGGNILGGRREYIMAFPDLVPNLVGIFSNPFVIIRLVFIGRTIQVTLYEILEPGESSDPGFPLLGSDRDDRRLPFYLFSKRIGLSQFSSQVKEGRRHFGGGMH